MFNLFNNESLVPLTISPLPFASNDMIIWNHITNESLNFASRQLCFDTSVKYGIVPGTGLNLSPLSSAL